MSISSIRQRKLFKNNKNSLQRLLNDSHSSEKQQVYRVKTEISDHRDSYSSRPTLQSSNLSRHLTLLENKVNKQEVVTEKCFEQMESLEAHYEILKSKQNERYQIKKKLLDQRIKKQEQRNANIHKTNLDLIEKIIHRILTQKQNKENLSAPQLTKKKFPSAFKFDTGNETTTQKTNHQIASQFLQMIKFEKTRRQIKKLVDRQPENADQNIHANSNIEETLILDIKPMQEERESQSILLDDSFIN